MTAAACRIGVLVAALATALCACFGGRIEVAQPGAPGLAAACSRWNPSMQTDVLEAVFLAGGPLNADVDGWACGYSRHGTLVRVVFLHFQSERPELGRVLAPVIFEDGRLVGFGWHLLESEPDRYGQPFEGDAWGPPDWRAPPGWYVARPREPEGG